MAILFDLDGTLLDTSPDFHTAVNAVLRAENKPLADYATVRRDISFGSKRILAASLNMRLDNAAHKTYIEQILPKFLHEYAQTQFSSTVAFPGIDDLLLHLEQANITWGIVTNKHRNLTVPLLQNTGYFDRSACLVCGDDTPHPKPAPDPLLHACHLLDVDPKECIFIGDSINDVLAGKAAGMRTIAAAFGYVPSGEDIHSWQSDVIVHSPAEILPWIQKWYTKAD